MNERYGKSALPLDSLDNVVDEMTTCGERLQVGMQSHYRVSPSAASHSNHSADDYAPCSRTVTSSIPTITGRGRECGEADITVTHSSLYHWQCYYFTAVRTSLSTT
jgi:hypothetical protein